MGDFAASAIQGRNDNSYGDFGASSLRKPEPQKVIDDSKDPLKAHQTPGFHVPEGKVF